MAELLSGNEAIARGAFEAGVRLASGYPGTPSTEILENLVKFKDQGVYCEWAPNEKVAMEVAAGAALAGARSMVTMKHVGLNVAADPLLTLAYTGTIGGMMIVVADDPGMHSSQNEQDSRHYARLAKVPMLEPSDSLEARDFTIAAMEISERFGTPVLLRTCTRVSHSRSLVELKGRSMPERPVDFQKNPPKFVAIPAFARKMRLALEERLVRMQAAAEESPLNRIEWGDRRLGIITSSVNYQYVKEAFPDASVLKLGWVYPFPDRLIRQLANGVEKLLVVEELDPIIEEHVKVLGLSCHGRDVVPGIGELSTQRLMASRARLEGKPIQEPKPIPELADLPNRPPTLCAGCPHRNMYYALKQFDVIVTGDIGCYSLGVLPPLSRLDTILCMGASVSMAHGMAKAGNARKIVGILGDSTFFHSGVTGLLDLAYNQSAAVIIVLDNRTTAMTGHQDHPGTGRTLMGDPASIVSIEGIGRACGLKHVQTVDPADLQNMIHVIGQALERREPTLIVSRSPCILNERPDRVVPRHIRHEDCIACGDCLALGCPALESKEGYPQVNDQMCLGCGLCDNICELNLIGPQQENG